MALRSIVFCLGASSRSNVGRAVMRSLPCLAQQLCGVKTNANDLRVGNIIEVKGGMYSIMKAQHTKSGRGSAFVQLELRDVRTGNKTQERLRSSEDVERVIVTKRECQFLYEDAGNVVVMDGETFEQMDIPADLIGDPKAYLQEGMTLTLQEKEGEVFSAALPDKVKVKIAEGEALKKGDKKSAAYHTVRLENGKSVGVPQFVGAGDEIMVNPSTDEYVERA